MTTTSVALRPRVLADLLPGSLLRDVLLVAAAAALTGLAAQVSIPLVPVPVTLQTFTVLLAGAALGPLRGGASMLLYLAVGAAGVPWFAEQNSGIALPTFGYIVGFVVAAAVVGGLARRGADRTVLRHPCDDGPRQPDHLRDRCAVAHRGPERGPCQPDLAMASGRSWSGML